MSIEWIKMRIDLQSHPKIVRILSATKADKFRVIGGLHAVWGVFDVHSVDGVLHGYTLDTMDHIIGWPGFCKAVSDVGWLVQKDPETLVMPEFGEHNGKSAKRRAEDQKRKRIQRKSTENPQDVQNNSGQIADEKRTRKEKKRNKYSEQHFSCAESMWRAIARVAPKTKPPDLDSWAEEIRKLNELDNVSMADIERVFQWANQDPFWSKNILSPAKLRKQFGQLDAKCPIKSFANSNPNIIGEMVVR